MSELRNYSNQIILCKICKKPINSSEAYGWDDSNTFYCEKYALALDQKHFSKEVEPNEE